MVRAAARRGLPRRSCPTANAKWQNCCCSACPIATSAASCSSRPRPSSTMSRGSGDVSAPSRDRRCCRCCAPCWLLTADPPTRPYPLIEIPYRVRSATGPAPDLLRARSPYGRCMLNSPGNHGHSVGLSVGATNLAGTRDGQAAVIRPAEVTVHGQRLTGFVDRVGDPVPLVAPDGSKHRPEELLADALTTMAHAVTAGAPVSDIAVTVPAHWRASVVDTLRRNLRGRLPVISDATAALTALRANPGLPTHGVIVLCDFGGSGTSITLANAARDFSPFGETVRFPDFSGDQIDQALLAHVVAGQLDASQADPSSTAMVGSLVQLRDECRSAKERLSASTATAVVAELPGQRADIRVT